MADATAQIFAIILGGFLYSRAKLKVAFTILLIISIGGGLLIIFVGHQTPNLMPLYIGLSKFGVAGGFVLLLTSTLDMFPNAFAV